MDVVEAIDAWIDERIDDLSDDELENILEILDAVSASPLANVDAGNMYDDDIEQLVELRGGSVEARAHSRAVLRAALFGHAPQVETDDDSEDVDDDGLIASDDAPAEQEPTDDDIDTHDAPAEQDPTDDDIDTHDAPAEQDPTDDDIDTHDGLLIDGLVGPHESAADSATLSFDAGFLSDLADAQDLDNPFAELGAIGHDDFLTDVAGTHGLAESTSPQTTTRPVPLRDFDDLGPSFLPELGEPERSKPRRGGIGRVLLPVFMVLGIGVFVFGMLQLLNSLDGEGEVSDVATNVAATARDGAAEPEASPEPTEVPATPAPVDPSAPTPTPAPEPTPPPRIGIRLVTGDVMLASFPEVGGTPEISQLYDASDDDFSPAREIAWLVDGLGIVDNDGNVLIVDPDARRPQATIIYESGGGFGEAVEIAPVNDLMAIRTKDGDINLTPTNGRADPDVIQLVWDADEEGAEATDVSSVGSFVAFVLDDGNAQLIVTDADNSIVPIWVAGDQPPAFNVGGSQSGILLGVGQGAVARYRLDDGDGEQVESVWDPFARDAEPAIGYSSVGDKTAIVLGDGAILLADDTGDGPLLWDPESTEIRAFVALGADAQVVVLLENGSVVRIPLDPDQLIESIWDVTDETLSAANQVIVEPPAE